MASSSTLVPLTASKCASPEARNAACVSRVDQVVAAQHHARRQRGHGPWDVLAARPRPAGARRPAPPAGRRAARPSAAARLRGPPRAPRGAAGSRRSRQLRSSRPRTRRCRRAPGAPRQPAAVRQPQQQRLPARRRTRADQLRPTRRSCSGSSSDARPRPARRSRAAARRSSIARAPRVGRRAAPPSTAPPPAAATAPPGPATHHGHERHRRRRAAAPSRRTAGRRRARAGRGGAGTPREVSPSRPRAAHAVTTSRSGAIVTSPIPGTWSSSSTLREPAVLPRGSQDLLGRRRPDARQRVQLLERGRVEVDRARGPAPGRPRRGRPAGGARRHETCRPSSSFCARLTWVRSARPWRRRPDAPRRRPARPRAAGRRPGAAPRRRRGRRCARPGPPRSARSTATDCRRGGRTGVGPRATATCRTPKTTTASAREGVAAKMAAGEVGHAPGSCHAAGS